MSQLANSLVIWLEETSVEKLFNLEFNIKRVITIKGLISQKEKEIKSLDEQLLGILYTFTGKSKQEAKEEKRREIIELNKLLKDRRVRNIGKLDIPSLRSLGKMIDTYIDRKLAFEDPILRKFIMTPAEREEYDRKKKETLDVMRFSEKRRLESERLDIKKGIILNEQQLRVKKEKQESFNKLKNDLIAQIDRTPYRNSPFNFVEPVPGCHYDIGPSIGHVVVPIPQLRIDNPDYVNSINPATFLDNVHEYTYLITEQIYDNLGGKIDIQIITVEKWHNVFADPVTGETQVEELIRIHNTKFYSILARSEIMNACDKIKEKLENDYSQHNGQSNIMFAGGLVMKLQYRINRSSQKTSRKKYKGGAYIDHLQIPALQIN